MNRWYRQSLPPKSFWSVFLALLLGADLLGIGAWLAWGRWIDPSERFRVWVPFVGFGVVLCGAVAGFLAVRRINCYPNLSTNKDFHSWLAATPWQSSKRTPFGPWHPVVQDVIPLGFLGIVAAFHAAFLSPSHAASIDLALNWSEAMLRAVGVAVVVPTVAFLAAWTVSAYGCIWRRWNWSLYLPTLWLGILIHLVRLTSLELVLTASGISFAMLLVLSWRRMNFELTQVPEFHTAISDAPPQQRRTSTAFAALSPSTEDPTLARGLQYLRPRTFAVGLLLFVWLTLPTWISDPLTYFTLGMSFFVLAVGRTTPYGEKLTSHLGLLARWSTRQCIIPSYDRVWIPSILMFATGLAFCGLVAFGVLPPALGFASSIAVPIVMGLTLGPDYTTWSLTAPCRYNKRNQAQRRGA